MSLVAWLQRRRDPPPPSPIPEAAREVQKQADDLHRIVEQIRRTTEARERNA